MVIKHQVLTAFELYRYMYIESYDSNSHIGFDPDYEVIKKRDPLLTGLLSIGSLSSLSSSNKQSKTSSSVFVRCLKTAWLWRTKHLTNLVPSPTVFLVVVLLLLLLDHAYLEIGTLLRNENHTNSFRIHWHFRFSGQNVSRLHCIYRWLC